DAETGEVVATASHPETEMEMLSLQSGWAEQLPEVWWQNLCIVTKKLLEKSGVNAADLGAIGIGYQMHGLVTVDKDGKAIRPAIIWCDSRAVDIGEQAFREIGPDYCLQHYLNSPGNFTASKLKWVKDNEPALYEQIKYFMLPGDYIAYRLTGEAMTTVSGLSEGILWDFAANDVSTRLLDHYGIDRALAPPVAPTFGLQGRLGTAAAAELGLKAGVPVAYRAGDQPNNALSLGALNPGEVAATGGTSGVVYGVTDRLAGDPLQRVNSFAHVNHRPEQPRVGVLLCINGSGILYGWMRKQVANGDISYGDMEQIAATAPVGADGLRILPFGNGAERMFGNRNTGASILNLHFNRHRQAHL
ncbi:MAG: carbohydrate kinase, partial [Saprospiraceae bacterium]|nr:carbohydrate kinase [Saprospiraceae bacterium]